MPPPEPPVLVVLDTNVVLDLWLFADAQAAPLRDALQCGWLQALVTEATLAELDIVLQRDFARQWLGDAAAGHTVSGSLDACSRVVAPPAARPPLTPRCTDPDDQKFVDLAFGWPAAWLLSRDRAVLRLGRAARQRGLRIGTPAQWAAAQRPSADHPAEISQASTGHRRLAGRP